MKIGILSQWYDPEPGPAALPAVYAREFAARGHEVRVLTGFPNYPDGVLYDGYRIRRRTTEQRDGILVDRVALYPNHSSSALGRIANYASFAGSATVSGRRALRGLDALWVYNSPVTVSLPLLTHTRWGRVPYFLHVQDLWPDSLVSSGMMPGGAVGTVATSAIRRAVALTERKATAIGVISRSVRDVILERNPTLDSDRIVYAPNPTNEALFRPLNETRSRLGIQPHADGPVDVMYAGAIGEVQGLDALLDAAARIRDRRDIRITIVGDGISRSRLQQRAVDEDLPNVRFLGRVAQSDIPELMAAAQIQLVSLADAPFLAHTTPSKISTLLASGAPIIGQITGDGAKLIEDSGAGITVRPGDVAALSDAIVQVAGSGQSHWDALGERGRAFYDRNLSAASTADVILDSLARAVRTNGAGGTQ
jgi:glycosyltransferase involved in cell wall biosynthesis